MFELYDEYCHGGIDRRTFLLRAAAVAAGGLAVAHALMPRYANAQTISFTGSRIKASYVSHPSAGGTSGTMRCHFARPAGNGPFGTVLVVNENRGLIPYFENVARCAVVEGFIAPTPRISGRAAPLPQQFVPALQGSSGEARVGSHGRALKEGPRIARGGGGMRVVLIIALLLFATPAAGQVAEPGPIGTPTGPAREQLHWVPFPAAPAALKTLLLMRVCRPPGDVPVKLALINHGAPPDAKHLPSMEPTRCDREATRWFMDRGFAVAYPMRRGFGQTGGVFAENYGKCETPNFHRAGLAAADDVQAALAYAQALPFVRKEATIVVGQSAGGWATMALASRNPANVKALVNFAGGRGAHRNNEPNNNCEPAALVESSGRYGAKARQPMLWIYTGNDTYIAPGIARPMHAAFEKAGGVARFEAVDSYGTEGHNLFFGRGGSRIWGPMVERYLAERGVR